MNPDVADLHVNTLLSQVSIGYQPAGFFAARMFPVVPVEKQSDIYPVYDKSHWARDLTGPGAAPTGSYQAVRRAPGTRARTVGYKVTTSNTYKAINYALGVEIPWELRQNADSVFNLDRDATQLLQALLNLRVDREAANDIITNGGWGSLTVSNKWSDYGASTPLSDIYAGIETIRRGTLGMSSGGGLKMLVGALVHQRLKDHPDILDRVKYGTGQANPARVTEQLLAQLFEVDEYTVARSVYTDDEEGTAEASATYTDVVSDDVLLYYSPPGAQQLTPSAGYLFNWYSAAGGRDSLWFARKGQETRERYDWVELHGYLDWVVTNTGAGVLNSDAVD